MTALNLNPGTADNSIRGQGTDGFHLHNRSQEGGDLFRSPLDPSARIFSQECQSRVEPFRDPAFSHNRRRSSK